MTTRRVLAIAALTAALPACGTEPPARPQPSDLGCGSAMSAIEDIHSNLAFPPQFSEPDAEKRGGEFDVNRMFAGLPHLKMRDGFTLDYVYHQDGMGGRPVLYARPVERPPYRNESEYDAAPKQPDYLSFVSPQQSAEGYLELAILAMTAGQFYLDWHANYNDVRVLCDADDIEDVIASTAAPDFGRPMTDAQIQAARAIADPQPTVVLTDESATVSMLVFTKWGGFQRRTSTINRADHSIVDVQNVPLVEYDCGIMF